MTLADQVTKIRNSLLPGTLEFAVNHFPYYEETIGSTYKDITTIGDLRHLPFLDKQTLIDRQSDLIWNSQVEDVLTFTTGTTSKIGLMLRRSVAELHEIRKCWELANRRTKQDTQDMPLILELSEDFHGISQGNGTRSANVIQAPISRESHYYWLTQLLTTEFHQPGVQSRITVIRANITSFYYFTVYLLQNGLKPGDYHINKVALTGRYLSENIRTFLEGHWNALITDSYRRSEFAVNGTIMSEHPGYQHFVLPISIPEVVHPITLEPLETGLGVLVLTSLYPFAQRQLLLRYWTGDLVYRGPKSDNDDVTFKLKGRMFQSLLLKENEQITPLILPFDVQDIFGWLPDLYRPVDHHSLKRLWFLDSEFTRLTLSLPVRYTLQHSEDGKQVIHFEIITSYVPELYPDRINELKHSITAEFCRRNPLLAHLMREGRLEIDYRFLPPGASLPSLKV